MSDPLFPIGRLIQSSSPGEPDWRAPVAYRVLRYDDDGGLIASAVWGQWQEYYATPGGLYAPDGGVGYREVDFA